MLIKPDKLPSLITSYRSISLLGAIMKLFERATEKRLRKHLEDTGVLSKYQSGFRKAKYVDIIQHNKYSGMIIFLACPRRLWKASTEVKL